MIQYPILTITPDRVVVHITRGGKLAGLYRWNPDAPARQSQSINIYRRGAWEAERLWTP